MLTQESTNPGLNEPDKPAWSGFISPDTLLEQVRNTAPFLFPLRRDGAFLEILADTEIDRPQSLPQYFRVCLACHHATVATYVPTDVDTKIRGLLWRETRNREDLRAMADLGIAMGEWNTAEVSRGDVQLPGERPVSGHQGEWLSVMIGALGRLAAVGDEEYVEKLEAAIDAELRREARIFHRALSTPGLEIETLRLAMGITHNLGDVDQGISFWETKITRERGGRFGRLAHENTTAYDGAFLKPTALYKELLASEGHRHYPLRSVKPLRVSAELLRPMGPFFDDWGAMLATSPALNDDGRAEVLDALIRGCRKVANQEGYYRAIAGFREASAKAFDRAIALLPGAARRELRDPAMQRKISVPRVSFESRYRKRVIAMREDKRRF